MNRVAIIAVLLPICVVALYLLIERWAEFETRDIRDE